MKKIFIISFLIISQLCWATKYYIDEAGLDDAGEDGSISEPWASLYYACTRATTPGDTIYINSGTYTETTQSTLPVGVSIIGEGNTSIITSSAALNPIIALYSGSEGTDGAQSISYIKMDGNMTAKMAIRTIARKNVLIHHCEFIDFTEYGVMFNGRVSGDGEPTVYATGNQFHNNKVDNCSLYDTYGRGGLSIGGQDGILIYNDTIRQTTRAAGSNGYCIKYANGGYNKGIKIYENYIEVAALSAGGYAFAIEFWDCRGGIEIYNNTIYGGIDMGGYETNDEYGYGFAAKIYNNILGRSSMNDQQEVAVYLERQHTGGMYIYNNYFANLAQFLKCYQGTDDLFEDIYFYYNIIYNLGWNLESYRTNGIIFGTIGESNITYDNLNFFNNVFDAGPDAYEDMCLRFGFKGYATNINVKNNIIQGFSVYPIYFQEGIVSNVNIENNIFYQKYNEPVVSESCTMTNYVVQNNLTSDPSFVTPGSDYHLQEGSPAINTGINVGLTYDYEGNLVSFVPCIGAYEYGSNPPPESGTVFGKTSSGKFGKHNGKLVKINR